MGGYPEKGQATINVMIFTNKSWFLWSIKILIGKVIDAGFGNSWTARECSQHTESVVMRTECDTPFRTFLYAQWCSTLWYTILSMIWFGTCDKPPLGALPWHDIWILCAISDSLQVWYSVIYHWEPIWIPDGMDQTPLVLVTWFLFSKIWLILCTLHGLKSNKGLTLN